MADVPLGSSGALYTDLVETLNRHSAENRSDTPDYILAQYIMECLQAFEKATNNRDGWLEDPSGLQVGH